MGRRKASHARTATGWCLVENNAYYIAQPLERLGLTLLICTELQPLRAQALYNALVNMAAISFVGLLLLAVSHIQVRKMLSHLEQTRKAVIDLPEGADLSSRLPDTWNDEAGELAAAFKRLNSRVNEYYHRLLQEEKDKRHAQQIALQYQLNPHFCLTPFIGFNFSWKTGTWTIRSAMP